MAEGEDADEAAERAWLEGFANEPEADEAEWDEAEWEEGDGEVTVRAGDWEALQEEELGQREGAAAGGADGEGSADEEEPEEGPRSRYELRYTLVHPATRAPLCAAGDVLPQPEGAGAGEGAAVVVGGVIHDRQQRYASHYTVEYLLKALGVGAAGIDEEELQAIVENAPVGLLLLWIAPGESPAVSHAAVLRLMGRDSGVNFPCAEMLAAARPADETELGLARAYLDNDLATDRQIWNLLRDSALTSTRWEAGGEGGSSLLGSVRMSARLPHPHQAQRTGVVRVKKFLSAEDIAAIHAADAAAEEGVGLCRRGDARWRTRYLHTAGHFRSRCPELLQRIVALGRQVDADNWQLLCPSAAGGQAGVGGECVLSPRCVEYHTMEGGAGGLGLGLDRQTAHYDQGSVLTVDMMLSDSAALDGGRFQTLEPGGEMVQHDFEQGDALLFVSHKYHSVSPLVGGRRQVLVVELWEGEERACPHRCVQHWGACRFGDGCGDGDGATEVGDATALAGAVGAPGRGGHY